MPPRPHHSQSHLRAPGVLGIACLVHRRLPPVRTDRSVHGMQLSHALLRWDDGAL